MSVFLLSSLLKSVNIHSFALEARMYVDAYMADWLRPFVSVGAIAVCAVEMLVALLALKRGYSRATAAGFFLMLSFFVYLTGANLFFPTVMGSIESCGCFGELVHFTPAASFAKSVALWVTALVYVVNNCRHKEPWNVIRLLRDRYLYVCTAASVALPLYSLRGFNEMGHTAYIAGFVALCAVILCVVVWAWRNTSGGDA